METYKPVTRLYWDEETESWKQARFIAGGTQADGHLAYSMIDENDNEIEGEETAYYQQRYCSRLVMFHI